MKSSSPEFHGQCSFHGQTAVWQLASLPERHRKGKAYIQPRAIRRTWILKRQLGLRGHQCHADFALERIIPTLPQIECSRPRASGLLQRKGWRAIEARQFVDLNERVSFG